MTRVLHGTDLSDGWEMALVPDPADPSALHWLPATVPGTAAMALIAAGLADDDLLATLDQRHIWFRTRLSAVGAHRLTFDGLATDCDIWLNGAVVGTSRNMYLPVSVAFVGTGEKDLLLKFRPLSVDSGTPSRRQRWRPHLLDAPHLRTWRTSALGHMPGWCPRVPPVGPYRPVRLEKAGGLDLEAFRLCPTLQGTTGRLVVRAPADAVSMPATLHCAGHSAPMVREGAEVVARLSLPDVPQWWPHTHGAPVLHEVWLETGGMRMPLGRTGFRQLSCDTGADGRGFALRVNGIPVFCRGANWTPVNLAGLPCSRDAYLPMLTRARDAGMNMLRISGIMTHEATPFFDLCDELGILVWQDMMLANFDYDLSPEATGGAVLSECAAFLARTHRSPALAVVCGGSEMAQQAAMLSLPERVWRQPFFETDLPAAVASLRPDVVVVPNSPFGGDLPFRTDVGVCHYFGVGAYKRDLGDARRANIRFASECLAFAHLPQPEALAFHSGGAMTGSAEWQARVVRDLKADWDFEDTRDHYVGLLYGVDAAAVKRQDPARYLALSHAAPGEVMAQTFAEWRRAGSATAGALVWFLADVAPGFGWGVIDSEGRPKPAYYALKRAFQPLTVAITDEGLNGLGLHVINDSAVARQVRLTLTCYGADGAPVLDGSADICASAHSCQKLSSAELFGLFFDVTAAYHFGPAPHVASIARLVDADTGDRLAEDMHFPLGRSHAMQATTLSVECLRDAQGWRVDLHSDHVAQSIHIAAPGYEPEDDWFHLAPGSVRSVRLRPTSAGTDHPPEVTISMLNVMSCIQIRR